MKKITAVVGGIALAAMLGAMLPVSTAHAARHKVDCSKVMDDINGGKSVKETAADLHISKSSVRRCQKKAKAAGGGMASPAAESSPLPQRLLQRLQLRRRLLQREVLRLTRTPGQKIRPVDVPRTSAGSLPRPRQTLLCSQRLHWTDPELRAAV